MRRMGRPSARSRRRCSGVARNRRREERLRNGMGETECTETQWPDHQSNRLTHDLQPPTPETNRLSMVWGEEATAK
ncbi:uncharacterized protein LOC113903623 isoform X3 [Bos indicus x Bos taurus]|uniref:uncharacterized protein LOC113903623 isoform X3 n=1 Tax=Bos indicus x Bos taurus TaxID=30522 RepID=UPI000F7D10BF|nr:uncharacterized protein LOC113903623 isoform X3 [Bos indicus x Bos taurus]